MQIEFKIKEQLRTKYYTTEKLLDDFRSSLRKRIAKANCNILDVGCGVSLDILDLIEKEHSFTAMDSDEFPLKELRGRIEKIHSDYVSKVNFTVGEFPKANLPYESFDAILFHSILHFFPLGDLIDIFKVINPRVKSGAVISVVVHSHKHPLNNSSDPSRFNFFKHYFTFEDLRKIFPVDVFKMEMECDFIATKTLEEIEFTKLWCREVFTKVQGITDEFIIKRETDNYIRKSEEASHVLHYMVRKI